MKKTVVLFFSVLLMLVACELPKESKVNVVGDWKFESYAKGTAAMNAQQQAIATSILSVFQNSEVSFSKDGKVKMNGVGVGNRKGTYTLDNNELSVNFESGGKFIVYLMDTKGKLTINLGKEDPKGAGQIFFTKK